MTITVTPVSNTQTFGSWLAVTNRLANLMSQNTVTSDATAGGSVTTGNSFVNGHFGANTLHVGTALRGGNLTTNAVLTIATNTAFAQSSITLTDGIVTISNTTSGTSLAITVANSTIIANGQYFLNANGSWERVGAAGVNTQIQFNSSNSFAGSASFTFNSANNRLTVGNSTVNAAVTPAGYELANSTVSFGLGLPTASQYANGAFFLNANGSWSQVVTDAAGGNTQIQFNNSNSFAGSANLTFINANNRLTVGNSTVNTAVTPAGYQIANSTVSFSLVLPTSTQYANGAFFLNANGSWSVVSSGGGYYKGNAGAVGDPTNIQNLFRINANTMTANVTIAAGENAQVTGPLTIANGAVLTIDSGGRVAII